MVSFPLLSSTERVTIGDEKSDPFPHPFPTLSLVGLPLSSPLFYRLAEQV